MAGLLLLPVLANLEPLYGWSRGEAPATPLAGSWFTPVFFWLRSLAYLAVWLWLAGTFRRPPGDPPDPRRRSRAMLGLGLHALVATLAAEDWVQSVDPALGSTAFGLLTMTIQASLALSAAALIAARDSSGRPGRDGRTAAAFADPMLVLLAIWSFLHAVQYLVVWSANLPDEARWYLARGGPLGRFAAWTAVAVVVIAALALAPRRSAGRPAILAAVAGMIFALHGGELFWLVTPAFRGGFRFTLSDLLALIGVVGVAAVSTRRSSGACAEVRRERGARPGLVAAIVAALALRAAGAVPAGEAGLRRRGGARPPGRVRERGRRCRAAPPGWCWHSPSRWRRRSRRRVPDAPVRSLDPGRDPALHAPADRDPPPAAAEPPGRPLCRPRPAGGARPRRGGG